jgi:NADH:ubiquinone oxidoreductase subunit 5 (subunit L)/multisubunit Na+/H+ antiporter MnhA subunit
MFLVISYSTYYSFDILSLNNQIYINNNNYIYIFGYQINSSELLALFLLLAAFIKSAQIGGHSWLPDSMEAPVPASSLIHSATLVSAGVYLILRFNFIFDSTEFTKLLIPVFGSLTAAYGGICAIAQSDIKKTLAYSTISHCGFLMVLCASEMNEFTILYLYVHGFFKAGVFMCVGNVLRISRGYQDTRRMGGLLKYLPFEYFCITIGLLNLAGLPFTFGFFIKHLLLISLSDYIYIYYFVVFNSTVGAFSGLFYSYRILFYTFIDFKKGDKILYQNLNRVNYNSNFYTNSSKAATISIFFLFIFSYIITFFLFKFFTDSNFLFSDFINTTVLTNYYFYYFYFTGFLLNFSYINITVVFMVFYIILYRFKKTLRVFNLYRFLFLFLVFLMFLFLFLL